MNGVPSGWVSASTVTCRSSMHSSSADCVFGDGAVDLVAEHDVGEDRARAELEVAALLVEDVHAGDVGGQQVGRELDAAERAVDRPGDRLGEHGLADAGHVLDQQVALGEQGDERQPDLAVLAADDPLDVASRSRGTGRRTAANPVDAREPPPVTSVTCERPSGPARLRCAVGPVHRTPASTRAVPRQAPGTQLSRDEMRRWQVPASTRADRAAAARGEGGGPAVADAPRGPCSQLQASARPTRPVAGRLHACDSPARAARWTAGRSVTAGR